MSKKFSGLLQKSREKFKSGLSTQNLQFFNYDYYRDFAISVFNESDI